MFVGGKNRWRFATFLVMGLALLVSACAGNGGQVQEPPKASASVLGPEYLIGPGDKLQIFVWRNAELSTTLPVRPDGRISIPLVEDIQAAGKTPTQLAREIEKKLKVFIQDPVVTVIVTEFVGPYSQQVRVIGEATRPQAIPYRDNMSLLDVMIEVGGLTQFAAGNRAVIVRRTDGKEQQIHVNLSDLIKDGNLSANMRMQPGDVLIVPQSWF